jgi:hypothetical protein
MFSQQQSGSVLKEGIIERQSALPHLPRPERESIPNVAQRLSLAAEDASVQNWGLEFTPCQEENRGPLLSLPPLGKDQKHALPEHIPSFLPSSASWLTGSQMSVSSLGLLVFGTTNKTDNVHQDLWTHSSSSLQVIPRL